MIIVDEWPPNIEELRAVFPIAHRTDVLFAFGDRIYAPGKQTVHPASKQHEEVHGLQQLAYPGGVEAWWREYVRDPAFRLAEEIPAHRAEYLWWACQPNADRPVDGFRSARLYHLTHIARRLSSPLYGAMIGLAAAKRAIEGT